MANETPNRVHAGGLFVPTDPVPEPFTSAVVNSQAVQSFERQATGQSLITLQRTLAFSEGYAEASLPPNFQGIAGAQLSEDGATVLVTVLALGTGVPVDPPLVSLTVWAVREGEGVGPAIPFPAIPPPIVPGAGLTLYTGDGTIDTSGANREVTVDAGAGSNGLFVNAIDGGVGTSGELFVSNTLVMGRVVSGSTATGFDCDAIDGIRLFDGTNEIGAFYHADYSTEGPAVKGNRWIPDLGAVIALIGAVAAPTLAAVLAVGSSTGGTDITSPAGVALGIIGGDAAAVATGAPVNVTAGAGGPDGVGGVGGALNLTGGASPGTGNFAGAANLTGGAGFLGGPAVVSAGASSSTTSSGAQATLQGGLSTGQRSGGRALVQGGATNAIGGGFGTGAAHVVSLAAGGTFPPTGPQGTGEIFLASGPVFDGEAGTVQMNGGDTWGGGDAASCIMQGGDSTQGTGSAGGVFMRGGFGNAAGGGGGQAKVEGGPGSTDGAVGGIASIIGGNGNGGPTASDAGDVFVTGGNSLSAGGGGGGSLNLAGGTSVAGSPGVINLLSNIFASAVKAGATQIGAGAAVNELWKTLAHVSLPDDVLMVGA